MNAKNVVIGRTEERARRDANEITFIGQDTFENSKKYIKKYTHRIEIPSVFSEVCIKEGGAGFSLRNHRFSL